MAVGVIMLFGYIIAFGGIYIFVGSYIVQNVFGNPRSWGLTQIITIAGISPRFPHAGRRRGRVRGPSIAIGVIAAAFTRPASASGFLSTFGILGAVIMYLAANVALIVEWARRLPHRTPPVPGLSASPPCPASRPPRRARPLGLPAVPGLPAARFKVPAAYQVLRSGLTPRPV